ncbi:hypothetical protein ACOME3_007644 [Neoechinorhynchus agilis]
MLLVFKYFKHEKRKVQYWNSFYLLIKDDKSKIEQRDDWKIENRAQDLNKSDHDYIKIAERTRKSPSRGSKSLTKDRPVIISSDSEDLSTNIESTRKKSCRPEKYKSLKSTADKNKLSAMKYQQWDYWEIENHAQDLKNSDRSCIKTAEQTRKSLSRGSTSLAMRRTAIISSDSKDLSTNIESTRKKSCRPEKYKSLKSTADKNKLSAMKNQQWDDWEIENHAQDLNKSDHDYIKTAPLPLG